MLPAPALEGKCCWTCKSEVAKNPAAVQVMLTTRLEVGDMGNWMFPNPDVDTLKATMTQQEWNRAYGLASQLMYLGPAFGFETMHDRFGQVKELNFRRDTIFRPLGTLFIGTALEVICHERHQGNLMNLFESMSAHLVEPHHALRMYKDLDLREVLDSAVIISPHYETVKIIFPAKRGYGIEEIRLPDGATDLDAVIGRVATFLRNARFRCRAVFVDNIYGLGNPDEARELPAISRFIGRIREVFGRSRPIWIVLGICLPDENPYNRMRGTAIETLLNTEMNHEDVQVLNFWRGFKAEVRDIEPAFHARVREIMGGDF